MFPSCLNRSGAIRSTRSSTSRRPAGGRPTQEAVITPSTTGPIKPASWSYAEAHVAAGLEVPGHRNRVLVNATENPSPRAGEPRALPVLSLVVNHQSQLAAARAAPSPTSASGRRGVRRRPPAPPASTVTTSVRRFAVARPGPGRWKAPTRRLRHQQRTTRQPAQARAASPQKVGGITQRPRRFSAADSGAESLLRGRPHHPPRQRGAFGGSGPHRPNAAAPPAGFSGRWAKPAAGRVFRQ